MSVRIMIAGCSKDERDSVEASVKAAFAERPQDEPWNVSLVNVASQWSIEIDGPEPAYKGLSLVAQGADLTASLRQALTDAALAGSPNGSGANGAGQNGEPASGGEAERSDRHTCEGCAASFDVIYETFEGEPEELCPVACPHCWHVNQIAIAAGAGVNGDYRAQAAS